MKKLLWIQKTITFIILFSIVFITKQAGTNYLTLSDKEKGYQLAQRDIDNFMNASTYLTNQARLYAETENVIYLYNYFTEIEKTKRRETALSNLINGAGEDVPEIAYLQKAYTMSNELAQVEYHAMRLVANANYLSPAQLPDSLKDFSLTEEELAYQHNQALSQARYLLFNATYLTHQEQIQKKTSACCRLILSSSEALEFESKSELNTSITKLYFLVILLFICEFSGSIIRFRGFQVSKKAATNDISNANANNKTNNNTNSVSSKQHNPSKSNSKHKNSRKKKNKGFTHFDLIITACIVTILICLLAPMFFKYLHKTRDTKAQQNATQFRKLVELVLVDSMMKDSAPADFACYQNYQAFSTRYLSPNEYASYSAQQLKKDLDFGKDQYDVIATYNDSTVTQLVYKDLKHQVIYVWFCEEPQGTVLRKKDYINEIDNWLRFESSETEEWVPLYTMFQKNQVCWNGFEDPEQFRNVH